VGVEISGVVAERRRSATAPFLRSPHAMLKFFHWFVPPALFFCLSPVTAADLHTLGNKMISGEVAEITDKYVALTTLSGVVKTPLADILRIELQRESAIAAGVKYLDVELADGSVLHCGKVQLRGQAAELSLVSLDSKLTIPLTAISSILNDAQDPAIRQEWQEKIVAKKHNQDILAIRLNGVLNGIDGTLADGANDKGLLPFEYDSGGSRRKREIDPARVQGMVFLRTLPTNAAAPVCKLYDASQNVVIAAKIELTDAGFSVTTVAGPRIVFPKQAVTRLDFSNDKVVFLSDLKPAELIEKTRQGRKDSLHLDKNLENGPLKIEGQTYAKGLAIHAHTELVYNLDGKYQKFEVVIGMDDVVGNEGLPLGRPLVKIEGDGRELFSQVITRRDKRRDLPPFDVKGVRQLRIVVTSTGLLDFGDHVDLANAKLSK
jgi:hypothetical protein